MQTNDAVASYDIPSRSSAFENVWVVLVLLTIGWMIAFIDRGTISGALADKTFNQQFALTNIQRGWLASALFWSYAVVQLPLGWVVDRYGVKWPYAISFALWCIASASTGLAETLSALVMIRFVVGATEAVVIPASYRYIATHFEESKKGLATGIFSVGGKLGPALGAPIATTLIVAYSWKAMFVVSGLLGLIWLVPWLLIARNDFPSKEQLVVAKRSASSVPMRSLLVSPVVWGGFIMTFCSGYFIFYAATWMPAYLVEQRGLSLNDSGIYTFFSFVSGSVVAVAAAWVADRLVANGRDVVAVRKAFVVAGCLGGMTILLGAYSSSQTMALFWNVASLCLFGLSTANTLALAKITLIPKPAIGLTAGLLTIATSLSGGVSASLAGWLLDIGGDYTLPMVSVVVFLLIGATSAVVLMRREWSPRITEAP